MKVYHVAPAPYEEYGWEIRAEGEARAKSIYQSKIEALAEARRLARTNPSDQVFIHHRDGSVESASAQTAV